MEVFVLGILLLGLYVFVRACAKVLSWFGRARYGAYRQLAGRYRGRYESRGLGEPPTVSFTYNGSTVRVGLAPHLSGGAGTPRTRVVARFGAGGLPLRLELAPILRPAPTQPPKGTRLVRGLESNVQKNYVVQANDEDIARAWLEPQVCASIEVLRRMAPPTGMLVSVNPERLLVQVDRNLGVSFESLSTMVREALVLHDTLNRSVRARVHEGIAIVEAGAADPAIEGSPVCKVCGVEIEPRDPKVTCAACRTPHHRDCWEFIGGCSVFGCQSKRSA